MGEYFSSQQADEDVVMIIRKHWIHFLPNIILASIIYLIGLFAIFALPALAPVVVQGFGYNIYILVVSLLFLFNTANFFSAWLLHYLTVGIITTEHIVEICQENLFSRKVSSLGLDKIQDVSAEQKGMAETFFNYGTVDVQTAGELPNFLFHKIPDPNETAQKIMEIEEEYSKKHGLRGLNANQNMVKNNLDNQSNANNLTSPNPESYPQIEYPNQQQQ